MIKQTALYQAHIKIGGTMVDFGGYLMPMRYKKTSIVDEHLSVRNSVGMFDTSHMGRIWVTGRDSLQFLDLLVPRNLTKLQNYEAGYTFMLNEQGGFRDDVIITKMQDEEFMIVCNASNFEKIWYWIISFQTIWNSAGKEVDIINKTSISSMIAVQGPKAHNLLERLSQESLPTGRFRVKWIEISGTKMLFSTTGYTGASGAEIITFSDKENIVRQSESLWNILLENNVIPCALGSRDTLRMEAGYRLYGNDIDESISLLESGLNFKPFADIEKENGFIGQKALRDKPAFSRNFVGFKLLERGIPRHGNSIMEGDRIIGTVLSGTQSPLTKDPFGMALVELEYTDIGKEFSVDIRGKLKQAKVVKFPIYDESIYGINIRK